MPNKHFKSKAGINKNDIWSKQNPFSVKLNGSGDVYLFDYYLKAIPSGCSSAIS
jgi:hypothetical protein